MIKSLDARLKNYNVCIFWPKVHQHKVWKKSFLFLFVLFFFWFCFVLFFFFARFFVKIFDFTHNFNLVTDIQREYPSNVLRYSQSGVFLIQIGCYACYISKQTYLWLTFDPTYVLHSVRGFLLNRLSSHGHFKVAPRSTFLMLFDDTSLWILPKTHDPSLCDTPDELMLEFKNHFAHYYVTHIIVIICSIPHFVST